LVWHLVRNLHGVANGVAKLFYKGLWRCLFADNILILERLAGGPAELIHLMTFEPKNEPQVVWTFDEVKVSAVRSTHSPGHASYRVDTPAGSVVIGGDAGNDKFAPPLRAPPLRRSRCWQRGPTLSFIRLFIRSWVRTKTAACRRQSSSARAQHPIWGRWQNALASSTSCSHT
jgi:hypothetical protein